MYHYLLCGLKIKSDLAFPELTPWVGSPDHPCDVEFRLGLVTRIDHPDRTGERFESQGNDRLIFFIEPFGRVLIEGGRRIVFDAYPGVEPERVRIYFIGTLQSILWYQRGLLPLHASAVIVGDGAVAVGGLAGCGKSVTAAALVARHCPLVADDFTVLDCATTRPKILPGYQKLRLWQDACIELDLSEDVVAKAHPTHAKFVVSTGRIYQGNAVPLTDIFVLSRERQSSLRIKRLGTIDAVRHLLPMLHRIEEARGLGRQAQIFAAINVIATKVRVWHVLPPDDLGAIGATADAILETVSSVRVESPAASA